MSLPWPHTISMKAFREAWDLEGTAFWLSVFEMHKDKMQIKNPKIAAGNLEKIFTATFKLANSRGFQAMSLRDLSRETGISMGGLYAYIGSKNDLASVIEGVMRNYIEQVIGDLLKEQLGPVGRLRAIIFSELYIMEIMHPWYHFCFMELKGLPREQQKQAMDLELRFEGILIDAIQAGMSSGEFSCDNPVLLAAQVTAQLQQWYLKHWKFILREVTTEQYAGFIFDTLLNNLGYTEQETLEPDQQADLTQEELAR